MSPGWSKLPNEVVDRLSDIGVTALAVYCILCRFGNADGQCHPSVATIARIVNRRDRTVQRALSDLRALGLVAVGSRPGIRSRCYTLLGHPDEGDTNVTSPRQTTGDTSVTPTPASPLRDTSVTPGVTPVSPKQDCEEKDSLKKRRARFVLPTFEEVASYCGERGNKVDAQKWYDYYTSNGWRVGRNPMRDWKAAVRSWERNDLADGNGHAPRRVLTVGPGQRNPEPGYGDIGRF